MYGVALHDAGRRAEATKVIESALARHPYDRELLVAAASYDHEAGNGPRATKRARVLVELDPDDPNTQRFAREMAGEASRRP